MKNVTITLDEEVARWARIKAAEEDTSVSQLVGQLLRQLMQQQKGFDRARRDFQRLASSVISDSPYPRREELHDRPSLR